MRSPRPVLLCWLPLLGCLLAWAWGAEQPWPVLTTAASIRQLTAEEAAQERPVQLSGILLVVTRQRDALVLRDATDGIYVEVKHSLGEARRPGDLVEVTGVTGAGDFAPMVRARRLTWVGVAPLPEPRPTTMAELNAGGFDAAWVELEGIVRSCQPMPADPLPVARGEAAPPAGRAVPPLWAVTLAQGADRMTVQVRDRAAPEELIDARVKVRGVVFNVHNANRQFVRAHVQVPSREMIRVVTPPAADPFALPTQPIEAVMRFTPTGFTGHRIHVRGIVTAHQPGRTLWLRDGHRGLRVASEQPGALAPGDEVDVVGFAEHGGYAPSLGDASFRRVAAGAPPRPVALRTPDEISRQDSNLVEIEARLDELRATADGVVLDLAWKDQMVRAHLVRGAGEPILSRWEPGSWLRVTGICVPGQFEPARPAGRWVADQMQLLLRDQTDVAVVRPAPWLNARRGLWLAIAAAVVVLLALIIVAVLARRQIRQREEARKLAEVEFAAMLAERNRLARELHDTIAQDLNAVSMQMELARNSAREGTVADVLPHLVTAHGIVRGCLAEARESIWDMRSHILEKTDLPGALRAVAEQLSAGSGCATQVRVAGRPRRLPPMIENNLLRIGQEAVSNALKHAHARTVTLEISFAAGWVRLTVADDGRGFDPDTAGGAGHFGLRGMRERVQQMNGELQLRSGATGGTGIAVAVPVADF